MRIALASDHAGYTLKEELKRMLRDLGHEVRDFGTHSADQVDYPDFIVPAAEAVASAQCDRGIIIGGSGNGEAIVANKVPGVRCTLCWGATPDPPGSSTGGGPRAGDRPRSGHDKDAVGGATGRKGVEDPERSRVHDRRGIPEPA